jgi:hypothetical protein
MKCIHARQVYSLLDTPIDDDSYKKLSKHLESCSVCHDEFKNVELKSKAAQVYIPKAIMDHDLRESFEREVGELFKVMELNQREILRKNVKKGFHFIDRMGIDFLKNLASASMLKTYFIALAIYVGLKFYLH